MEYLFLINHITLMKIISKKGKDALIMQNSLKCRWFMYQKNFISQPRIKNDGLCFDVPHEIIVDVNVAFLVVIHGIAFADLNFLNQAHQRGAV